MSDYEILTAGDTNSSPASEEHSIGGPALQSAPFRRMESMSVAAVSSNRAFSNRAPQNPQAKKDLPEQILRAFNTWAFKREQPSDPQLMLQVIAEAVARKQPVPFVFYWGKGPRCKIDDPDRQMPGLSGGLRSAGLRRLRSPGASMQLIFTDTHARLNGYSRTRHPHYIARRSKPRRIAARLSSAAR